MRLRIDGLLCAGALVALALLAGCGGDGGGGSSGGQVTTVNLAPFFQGVESVTTAGGARVLVTWQPATDDHDAPGEIRYRIFLSDTSDGFDFNAPVMTTPAGATRVQLTTSNSPLVQVGQEVFVAVRALDTEGGEDLNAVECAVTCVSPAAVAYVRPGPQLSGTVGNPLDPFSTIQEAVEAVPPSGGIVVIAGGVYHENVVVSELGASGSSMIGIFGSFDAADITAGTTAQILLDGNDPSSHPTILDGEGVDPGYFDEYGVMSVHNAGRRTYVSRLVFRDNEPDHVLFGGYGLNVVLSGTTFVDPDPEDESRPSEAVFVQGGEDGPPWSVVDLVGLTFTNLPASTAALVMAPIQRFRMGCCSAEDISTLLYGDMDIKSGTTLDFRFESNWAARGGTPLDVAFYPYEDDQPGNSDIRILGNRLTGFEDSVQLYNLGLHGRDGTLDVLVERNFVGPVDDSGITLELLPWPGYPYVETTPLQPQQVNVTFRDNSLTNIYGYGFEVDRVVPGMEDRVKVLVEDSTFVGIDSEAFSSWTNRDPSAVPFSQDGAQVTMTVRDVTALGTYQFAEMSENLMRGGTVTFEVMDSVSEGVTGDYGVEIYVRHFSSNETGLDDYSAPSIVRVTDNVLTMGYDYEAVYVSQDVSGRDSVLDVSRNAVIASYYAVDLNVYFPGGEEYLTQDGENGTRPSIAVTADGNVIEVAEEDPGLYLWLYGPAPADAFVRVANNRIRTGESPFEIYGWAPNLRGQLLLHGNSFLGSYDGDASIVDLRYGSWMALAARNLVMGGGIGGDDGLNFAITEVDTADVLVRNNVVAHHGEGIEFDGSVITGQLVNNTAAFCGSEKEDAPLGSEGGGRNSPTCVDSCVSWGNMVWDIQPEIVPVYTCLGYAGGDVGLGCVEVDPVFQQHGTPTDVNTWFALSPASPAVDAGDPDPDRNDPDGTRNDMGAFGGPGAGPVGFSGDPTDDLPFLIVGLGPPVDLYAGATLIGGYQELTVVFSDPVDATTVNASHLSFLVNGVALAGLYTVDGRYVTFEPAAGWPAGAEVHMVATTDLRSTLGTPLDFRHGRWFATAPATILAESEDNGSPEEADVLADGEKTFHVTGSIVLDDTDFYRVSGTAGARLQVSLFGYRIGQDMDFALRLWAPDGTTLLFENSWGLPGYDPFIDYVLPVGGAYYIEVFREGGTGGPTSGNYELQIWRFNK